MSNLISNKYYLQAVEAYPYDLTETAEALGYALSNDSSHAGAHCLLGQLHAEQLKQYDMASHHFEQALISNIEFTGTYEHYSEMLIHLGEYEKAQNMINHAYSIKGANIPMLLHKEGKLYETIGKLKKAKKRLKKAYKTSCNEEDRSFLKTELERVKEKLKDKRTEN